MAKTLKTTQAALTRARERRVALDAERDARDRRIEGAAAEVFMLLGDRTEAEGDVAAANAAIGQALRRVLDEGIGAAAAGRLVDLDVAEVRRLTKALANDAAALPPESGAMTGANAHE